MNLPHETKNSAGHSWLANIIVLSMNNPVLVLLFCLLVGLWSWRSLEDASLDAIPDLSETQVIILSEWAGQSPEIIEDQVNFPISSSLASTPKVTSVRSQSMYGVSFTYVIFEEGTDLYWARTRVQEQLGIVQQQLPKDVSVQMGPDASGIGWVLMYVLEDKQGKYDLGKLRTLQDWNIKYRLQSVAGVAEIASIGGYQEQFEVIVHPDTLHIHDISMQQIAKALANSNREIGANSIEVAEHEQMIRVKGRVHSKEDIEVISLGQDGLSIGDVATVVLSPKERRGIAEWNGQGETVGGIVVMRQGENALKVIEDIKAKITDLESSLPEGIHIRLAYDRSELIKEAIHTTQTVLWKEMLVVSLVILLFLGNFRYALVAVVVLPLAVLFSFWPLSAQHITINLMSLGGIAVSIGALVDAVIVLLDNIDDTLSQHHDGIGELERRRLVQEAMIEVAPSIFYSLLVLSVAFFPIFALEATEGRLFRPLAFSKTWTMFFASLLSISAVPALVGVFVAGQRKVTVSNWSHRLSAIYAPVVQWSLRYPRFLLVSILLLGIGTLGLWKELGAEFMPPLREGSILYMPSAPPGISATSASKVLQQMDAQLRTIPEVQSVFGKMGRAQTATDPAPLGMAETTIMIKPESEWRSGMTWEKLLAELDQVMQFAGMPNIWWMPIQTRIEMLTTGIRSPIALQLFGTDRKQVAEAALEMEQKLSTIPEFSSVFAQRGSGGLFLDITPNWQNMNTWDVGLGQLTDAVQLAVSGKVQSEVIEGRERRDIVLRYPREYRDTKEEMEKIWVESPHGKIPLSMLASVDFVEDAPVIFSENALYTSYVFVDTKEKDIPSIVQRANTVLENTQIAGIHWEWVGQYKSMQRANAKLLVIIPIALCVVCVLLYLNTKSVVETMIVLLAVPFSLIGAVFLLWWMKVQISVAVWVGILALIGLDAETGVIMLLYLRMRYEHYQREGKMRDIEDLKQAIIEGSAHRIRPKLMTVSTTMIGLLPLLFSHGVGADFMKPIAVPMVGGLVSSFALELLIYPVIFFLWKRRSVEKQSGYSI